MAVTRLAAGRREVPGTTKGGVVANLERRESTIRINPSAIRPLLAEIKDEKYVASAEEYIRKCFGLRTSRLT